MQDPKTGRPGIRTIAEADRPLDSIDVRAPDIPAPRVPTRRPDVRFPGGATDCHAHLFGSRRRYPMLDVTHFVPHENLLDDYLEMLDAIGCRRGVLVQPSVYGTDNSVIEDALRGPHADFELRAVAVVDPDVPERELERLHALGFRGVRINIAAATGGLTLEDSRRIADRIRPLGWHLQFHVDLRRQPDLEEFLASLDIALVIDHFARVRAADGIDAPGCRALLRLLGRENIFAKLSAPYFLSDASPGFDDVAPLAKAMLETAPDRLVWGTDWPHASARSQMPDDGDLADLLARWVPDERQRARILVSTPERLYGFGDP